jgi:hypothetical protein
MTTKSATPYDERFPSGKPKHVAKHGSYSEYTNYKCRCVHCRAANTRYNLKRRKKRAERLLKGEIKVEHGHYSTYTNYACRCDECKRANTERVSSSVDGANNGAVDGTSDGVVDG